MGDLGLPRLLLVEVCAFLGYGLDLSLLCSIIRFRARTFSADSGATSPTRICQPNSSLQFPSRKSFFPGCQAGSVRERKNEFKDYDTNILSPRHYAVINLYQWRSPKSPKDENNRATKREPTHKNTPKTRSYMKDRILPLCALPHAAGSSMSRSWSNF